MQGGDGWHSQLDDLTQDYAELEIPDAVSEVILRRFEGLSSGTKRLLQVASVLGEGITSELLAPLIGLSDWGLVAALEEAEAHGFLAGERFSHQLLAQAIYLALGEAVRRRLHDLVAETLELRGESQTAAEHWLAAGSAARAARAFLEAVKRYNAGGLAQQVIELTERAIPLAGESETAAWLRYYRADALLSSTRFDEAGVELDALVGEDLPDELQVVGRVLATHLALRRGDGVGARVRAAEALERARELRTEIYFDALNAGANAFALTGAQEAILPEFEEAVRARASELAPGVRCRALSNLAWLYCGVGRFEAAAPVYREAVALAKRGGDRYWLVWTVSNLLYCHLELGQPNAALAEAESIPDRSGSDASELLRLNLSRAYLDLGRDAPAEQCLSELLAESSDPTNRAVAQAYLAEICYRTGRKAEGDALLAAAFASSERTDLARARIRVAIAAIRHGDAGQREAGLVMAKGVERRAVAGFAWNELQGLLGA